MGATFLGEAIGGYSLPFLSELIFGNRLPSSCMIIGGVGCVICGILCLPVFKIAYKTAFDDQNK